MKTNKKNIILIYPRMSYKVIDAYLDMRSRYGENSDQAPFDKRAV